MYFLAWTPVIYDLKGIPRTEEGMPYLPSTLLKEAIESAVIYYSIKKDKEIESLIRHYLLKERFNPEEVVETIKKKIYQKYEELSYLELPERIVLDEKGIFKEITEVFDLETWRDKRDFKVEVFKGVCEVDFPKEAIDRFKAACHSYAEALAKMEMSMLKDHPLVEKFYQPLLNKVKKWELPLRVGLWTEVKYKGNLLFFWRIKEIRERFLRDYKIDIRPKEVLFFPRQKCTAGWCEITLEV